MKNDFMMHLVNKCELDVDCMNAVLSCLDNAVFNYDVVRKETSIVPYGTIHPLVQTFIVSKSVEGYADGTLYNYIRFLTKFFQYVQKAPEDVSPNDIRVYLYTYQKERGISNRSLDKVRASLAAFYKWMLVEGYIDKNPMVAIQPIKYEKKPKQSCTQMDLEYLRRACITLKHKAILEMLYSTGCRVGELVILQKSDIDWDKKTVHLFGKGKKHRISFLNAKAEVALREYLESRVDDGEYLFVSDRKPYNPMHVDGIQKIMRQMSERASSNMTHKVTPHILRHTMATRMVESNSDIIAVQRILGHSNINTTMTYIHSTMDNVQSAHIRAVV